MNIFYTIHSYLMCFLHLPKIKHIGLIVHLQKLLHKFNSKFSKLNVSSLYSYDVI